MPALDALAAELGPKGLGVLAVSLEPSADDVKEMLEELHVSHLEVAFADGEMLGPFYVNRIPSTVFVGRDGLIKRAASGGQKDAFLRTHAEALLGGR